MSGKKLFAVDMGASGGKCFAGEVADGKLLMQEIHRFAHEGTTFYVNDRAGNLTERTYWDDVYIYKNIVDGLRAYKRDVGDTLDAIGIDTWGADGNFVTANGDMLGKIYCYRDHRLDDMIDQVKSRIDAERIYAITGITFQPFNLSNQLHWFATHRKDMLQPGLSFLPIPSVFYYYLGGVKQVDSSWASVTQLMEAKSKTWSKEILDALEIPMDVMPEIVEPGTVVGKLLKPLADDIGINCPDLVAVGSHDTASAFAAAPVDDPAHALIISSGTWSLIGKLLPSPVTMPEALAAGISNEGGIGNIRFLKNCMGTWLTQELRRGWTVQDGAEPSWKDLDVLTEAAPAFGAFVDPDDPSFYNPANMETAIAEFCSRTGQATPQGRGAFLRMVYESLAMKYRMVNEQICEVSGGSTKVVNIVGGGTNNPLLNQFTADCLGLPVVAGPVEGTAIGNLMVQALGLGEISSMAEVRPIIKASFPITTYEPGNADAWNEAYERFRDICG